MKKLIILLAFISICTSAGANDTIKVDNTKIEKVIEHKTTNNKGNPVVQYYFLYNKTLVSTNKTTYDKYKLCRQYGAECKLILVKSKNNSRIVSAN